MAAGLGAAGYGEMLRRKRPTVDQTLDKGFKNMTNNIRIETDTSALDKAGQEVIDAAKSLKPKRFRANADTRLTMLKAAKGGRRLAGTKRTVAGRGVVKPQASRITKGQDGKLKAYNLSKGRMQGPITAAQMQRKKTISRNDRTLDLSRTGRNSPVLGPIRRQKFAKPKLGLATGRILHNN
jgi:hypothetical protein